MVDSIVDLGCAWIDRWVAVIAVRRGIRAGVIARARGRFAKTIAVVVDGDGVVVVVVLSEPIAVLIDAIPCDLWGTRVDRLIGVVAVED